MKFITVETSNNEFLKILYLKLQISSAGMELDLKNGGGGGTICGGQSAPWLK